MQFVVPWLDRTFYVKVYLPGIKSLVLDPHAFLFIPPPRYRPTCPLPKSSILSLYFPDRGPTCPEEYDLQTHPRPSSNASYHHGSSCRNSLSREAPSPRQGGKTKLDWFSAYCAISIISKVESLGGYEDGDWDTFKASLKRYYFDSDPQQKEYQIPYLRSLAEHQKRKGNMEFRRGGGTASCLTGRTSPMPALTNPIRKGPTGAAARAPLLYVA